MEPIFENRYYSRHNMGAEFFRKHGVGPRIPVVIVTLLFFAGLTYFCWMNGILGEMKDTLLLVGTIYLVSFFMPHLIAWSSLRNSRKQNDGVLPETVTTFGETIEIHEGMVRITVEYHKIVRVIRLKHSYVLMLGKRNGVMLDPDGFTKGTFAEFKQFLRTKCPDLTIPE